MTNSKEAVLKLVSELTLSAHEAGQAILTGSDIDTIDDATVLLRLKKDIHKRIMQSQSAALLVVQVIGKTPTGKMSRREATAHAAMVPRQAIPRTGGCSTYHRRHWDGACARRQTQRMQTSFQDLLQARHTEADTGYCDRGSAKTIRSVCSRCCNDCHLL